MLEFSLVLSAEFWDVKTQRSSNDSDIFRPVTLLHLLKVAHVSVQRNLRLELIMKKSGPFLQDSTRHGVNEASF